MERTGKGIAILCIAALVLAAFGLAACGSSSDAETDGGSSANASSEFVKNGASTQYANFGKEASTEEREAVSAILEENLKARASGDYAVQCASLSAGAIKTIVQAAATLPTGKGCGKELEAVASVADARDAERAGAEVAAAKVEGRKGKAPKTIREYTMTGPIDVFRVKGTQGFVLYHGIKGLDFVMPMTKEKGEWKVASLVTKKP